MDPYIAPSALDPANPWYEAKLENLRRADEAHRRCDDRLSALPSKVVLQTTDTCNLRCVMCQLPPRARRAQLEPELLERVAEELFPTLIELHPTNVGEPLIWPHFRQLCTKMARYGVLLDLTTNGTLLDEERLEWIAPIARDVKFSFDGAVADTFERIRRGADFSAVCTHVRRTVERLAGVSLRRPIVALQMTLMRSNYLELPDLVRLAAELGASRVKAYHLFSFSPEMDRESIVGERDLWVPAVQQALELGAALGVDLQLAEPPLASRSAETLRPVVCHLPWHEAWIDVDGAVLVCHSHGGEVAGNLDQQSFDDVWNGPLYRSIRAGWRSGAPAWHCRGCGMGWAKREEHEPVPYDPESFLSPAGRAGMTQSPVRWSSRMRPFDLEGRRGS